MNKIIIKDINLQEFVQERDQLPPDTNFHRLALRVLTEDPFQTYPSWFEEIVIPPGTKPSTLNWRESWRMLLEIREKELPMLHPVHTLDTILLHSDVKFENGSLAYTDNDNKPAVIPMTKGYFCLDSATNGQSIAAAHTADTLVYYTRANKEGDVSFTVPAGEGKKLKMLNTVCLAERKKLCVEPSITRTRDAVYCHLMSHADIAFKFCSDFVKQNLPYSNPSKEVTIKYYETLKSKKVRVKKEDVEVLCVPFPGPINPPPFVTDDRIIDQLYDYLNRSRMIRGENGGIGIVTLSYIFGSLPRSHVKNITLFLDIRQCLMRYDVNVIWLQGTFPEMVIKMLVRNGFFVISTLLGVAQRLDETLIKDRVYGVYSGLVGAIRYGIFHESGSKCHPFKKNKPQYQLIDVMSIFGISPIKTTAVFHALRCHIAPDMRKQGEYGYLPCALAHNAQLICVYPSVTVFPLNSLALRSAMANYIRNDWVVTKRPWYTVDEYRVECGYLQPFVMPMMRNVLEPKVDYSGKSHDLAPLVEIIDVPLGLTVNFKRLEPKPVDAIVLIKNVIREMNALQDKADFVKQMILSWDDSSNFVTVLTWKNQMHGSCQDLIDALMKYCVKGKDDIQKGVAGAAEVIEQRRKDREKKNKENDSSYAYTSEDEKEKNEDDEDDKDDDEERSGEGEDHDKNEDEKEEDDLFDLPPLDINEKPEYNVDENLDFTDPDK